MIIIIYLDFLLIEYLQLILLHIYIKKQGLCNTVLPTYRFVEVSS